jgi:hypothetical protein
MDFPVRHSLGFGMVSRLMSSVLLAAMLNVTALGGGLYSTSRVTSMSDMPGMAGMQDPDSQHGGKGDGRPDEGCELPWSPGCGSPVLCVLVAVTAPATSVASTTPMRNRPLAMVATIPESVEQAPDHPPPRG